MTTVIADCHMTESASEDELRGRAGLVSGVNFLLNRQRHYSAQEPLCESRGGRPGPPSLIVISLRFLWT